ncbi:hypothetical protein Zm00014a_005049 [Zea mays]|uniref:Uncharacterized protein n=1 Tax=Zea mays TaxID=4577 RepID=A0A3L6EPY7_MAIZE|nr:hypothetical protein Zm00014a_005049 [Zea mays]
MATGRVKSR